MDARLPAGVLDGDGHGALQGLAAGGHETFGVGWTGEAEEEGGAHVDEEDAPKDLADGTGHRHARVPGLGGGHGDGLTPGIKGTAEDEDGGDASEPGDEGTRVVPVGEADTGDAVDTTGRVDDGEDEVGDESG